MSGDKKDPWKLDPAGPVRRTGFFYEPPILTEMAVGGSPSPSPPKPQEPIGYDVLPGKWINDPVTERQKAMLALYGHSAPKGMTKGEAAVIINSCKQSGVKPSAVNQMEADLKFLDISRQERRRKLSHNLEVIHLVMEQIQEINIPIKELKRLRSKLRSVFSEIREIIDDRINEVDDVECALEMDAAQKKSLENWINFQIVRHHYQQP
jgi:hypothetical protein